MTARISRIYLSLGLCTFLFGTCAWAQRVGRGPGFGGGGFRNFGGQRVFRPGPAVGPRSFNGQPFRFSHPAPRIQGFRGWSNGGPRALGGGAVLRSPSFVGPPRFSPFGRQRVFGPGPGPRGAFFRGGTPTFFAGSGFFPHHGTFFFSSHFLFFFPHHRFFFTPLFFNSFFFPRPFFSTFVFGPFFVGFPLQPIWISNGLYPSFGCPYDDFYYPSYRQSYSDSGTNSSEPNVQPPDDDAPEATPDVSDPPEAGAAVSQHEASPPQIIQQESVTPPEDDQEPPSPPANEGLAVRSGDHMLFITSNGSASFGTTPPKPAPRRSR